jgi:hypothetical protein
MVTFSGPTAPSMVMRCFPSLAVSARRTTAPPLWLQCSTAVLLIDIRTWQAEDRSSASAEDVSDRPPGHGRQWPLLLPIKFWSGNQNLQEAVLLHGKLAGKGSLNAVTPDPLVYIKDDISNRHSFVILVQVVVFFLTSLPHISQGHSCGDQAADTSIAGEKGRSSSGYTAFQVDFSVSWRPAACGSRNGGIFTAVARAPPVLREALVDYQEVLNESGKLPPTTNGVEHHLTTTGQPETARFRCLDPDVVAKPVDIFAGWISSLKLTSTPLLRMDDLSARLVWCKIFSKSNLRQGYHQSPMHLADTKCIAGN